MGISHQREPVFSQLYLTLLFITDSYLGITCTHTQDTTANGARTASQPCLYLSGWEAWCSLHQSPVLNLNHMRWYLYCFYVSKTGVYYTPTSKAAHDHTLCQLLQKPARIATLRRVLVMSRSRFSPPILPIFICIRAVVPVRAF